MILKAVLNHLARGRLRTAPFRHTTAVSVTSRKTVFSVKAQFAILCDLKETLVFPFTFMFS